MPGLETTFSDARESLVHCISNAAVQPDPYPHFYCTDVFPDTFYARLLEHLPGPDCFIGNVEKGAVSVVNQDMADAYNSRSALTLNTDEIFNIEKSNQPFWSEFTDVLKSPDFTNAFFTKFQENLRSRFEGDLEKVQFYPKIDLISDTRLYALGPHTDVAEKVAVLILYLPSTDQNPHLGTSVYVPKDADFVCNGDAHYDRDTFTKVYTAPFLPNSAFGFFKTNNSFHGVEPVKGKDESRNLIQLSFKHLMP